MTGRSRRLSFLLDPDEDAEDAERRVAMPTFFFALTSGGGRPPRQHLRVGSVLIARSFSSLSCEWRFLLDS